MISCVHPQVITILGGAVCITCEAVLLDAPGQCVWCDASPCICETNDVMTDAELADPRCTGGPRCTCDDCGERRAANREGDR